jgi:glycosyltransferase involved in cell wall biosynthesis
METVMSDIVEGLDRQRFQSAVCCIKRGGEAAESLKANGARVEVLGRMKGKMFDLGAVLAIRRLIKDFDPHVIVTHQYHAGLYGRLAGLTTAARPGLVSCFHVAYVSPSPPKFHRRIVNGLLSLGSYIVAVSNAMRDDIVRFDGVAEKKVRVIYNGVDLDRFAHTVDKSASRARLGLLAGAFIIGTLGRSASEKNRVGFIDAVSRVGGGVQVAIAGECQDRAQLEEMSRALNVPLTLTGWLSPESVPDFLNALDVFCFPSLNRGESFGLAVVEAMAAGLPIAASDIPSNREVLGDAAVFAPAGDTAAMGEALARLYKDDTLRARLSNAALLRVPMFSIKNNIRAYEDLFEKAAETRAKHA